MFLPLSLSALPLACSAPWAEIFFAPFGRDSAPPEFFSAPAKINPEHATESPVQNASIIPRLVIHFPFLFPLKKREEKKGRMNSKKRDFKPCLSARSPPTPKKKNISHITLTLMKKILHQIW